ncbi:hypothetical protein EX30DRAFT_337039 [Ascodesmis nigricans]|uniref:Mediator of RNA polymerase II transcription subunit 9 n=1 Tax=Ascodesmis nigricans TaxID=341454 RepID=A0A4S2N5F4_9PEZI|nr:hypothetical protein EX30DRAFT_337039 [Ascodesmis nigricans]
MTTPADMDTSALIGTPTAASLPPNSFDFLPDVHALIQRVFNDELDPKNVEREAALIRHKIKTARNLVAQLPEVDKSVEQLSAEIQTLEDRISKQRGMLSEVASMPAVQEMMRRQEAS